MKHTIVNPSKDFQDFITQYFDDSMYVARGEYDTKIPLKLQGEELEAAKKIVAEEIRNSKGENYWLLYPAFVFELKDLIPDLKIYFESASKLKTKVSIGHLLYKWGELDSYIAFCKIVLGTNNSNVGGVTDAKSEIIDATYIGTGDAEENTAQNTAGKSTEKGYAQYALQREESLELLLLAVADSDTHVRENAFWHICVAFRKEYTKLEGLGKLDLYGEEKKYYIADEVYTDKKMFEMRLDELRKLLVA